ncbi:MAG TPA: class I SAM-dependent methyltransferase, partial [Longimicrobium sp.]|nr:class I SAM-dependent methyltransferase [Longimicrobium sp.]
MEQSFQRLVGIIRKRYDALADGAGAPSFALRARDGVAHAFGPGAPAFTLVANDASAVAALSTMDSMAVGEAYLRGSLDLEGDVAAVLSLRGMFGDRHPLAWAWKFVRPLLFGQVKSDASFIAEHYDEDPDFYTLFLDRKYRCYSQGVFEAEDEGLETGIERKLDFTLEAIGVGPGDRVLDVGGGWGAFTEYAGRKGIQVTSLTISKASERFIGGLIDGLKLPCRVLREHLYAHQPREKYDAIVNLGVTEHLPDYGRTLEAYARLLKPGGRVALDASATREKYDV